MNQRKILSRLADGWKCRDQGVPGHYRRMASVRVEPPADLEAEADVTTRAVLSGLTRRGLLRKRPVVNGVEWVLTRQGEAMARTLA